MSRFSEEDVGPIRLGYTHSLGVFSFGLFFRGRLFVLVNKPKKKIKKTADAASLLPQKKQTKGAVKIFVKI
jgi:hypothetical protein